MVRSALLALFLLALAAMMSCTALPIPQAAPPTSQAVAYASSQRTQLPIHIVYVNHVEVESVLDYVPPLVDGRTYPTTPEKYAFTSGQLEWEIAQAEAVGASISFHMSGAYAERALAAGDQALWAEHLAAGHTVGVHFHKFLRGPEPFQWTYRVSPAQDEIEEAWRDNHALVAELVGPEELWVGESHYGCPSCWEELGYRLKATEQMALLPAGEHIVWLVERDPSGVITYPHFPQIGQAGWHGPAESRTFFDLRGPQLKKEFLMLYLEWLERERLHLEPQVWAWGWANHAGRATARHAAEIEEMLRWLSKNFVGRTSPRGNVIARFVSDHELLRIYEDYERAGGRPLPSPLTHVNDQFPYMAYALQDAGVVAELSAELGLEGVRLFELERDPPQGPPSQSQRVYLLFRETDGTDTVDLSAVLRARGVDAESLTLIDVVDGSRTQVNPSHLVLGPTPLVLEVEQTTAQGEPLYVVVMTHVEGDRGYREGDPRCPSDLYYQTAPLPPPGQPPRRNSFAVDVAGTELLHEILQRYTDSFGGKPKLFIEPAGEFWQTEADPVYGGKLFRKYDWLALGYEFGIQGHGIYYSGRGFCWYESPRTEEGIRRKLTDLHRFAERVYHNGQKVNTGITLTPGAKIEGPAIGRARAEWVYDHVAYELGYRISFEDHDGHIEDEPPGINNSRASYYLYEADYGDGVKMLKIDFNGSVTARCPGNTPRCETPEEAIARLDRTLAARAQDPDPRRVYYFAFTVHSNGVWTDFHLHEAGLPLRGEGAGLTRLMDAIQERVDAGANIKFVTPGELREIYSRRQR